MVVMVATTEFAVAMKRKEMRCPDEAMGEQVHHATCSITHSTA